MFSARPFVICGSAGRSSTALFLRPLSRSRSPALAPAAVVSDQAAAIPIWPDVFVGDFGGLLLTDTVLQLIKVPAWQIRR